MRWLRLLPLLALSSVEGLSAAPQQPGPDDGVVVDEIKKEQLDRLKRCEETKDWKGYWAHLAALTARHGHQFLASGPDRYTGVRQHFLERSAALPSAALERWRFEYEPAAVDAFAKAREKGSRSALEAAASDYFFSAGADEVLDGLAREALDEGRNAEAASLWERLLRWYPDPDVPLPVLAARAAHAWAAAPSRAGIESVRAVVASRKIRGEVLVAGREEDLSAFLARLAPAEPPVLPPLPRIPSVPGVGEPAPRAPSLSNEIRRWTYDFAADRGEAPPAPPPPQVFPRGGRRFFGGQVLGGAPPLAEFPLFPAYGRSGGRDFVAFTDGYRVVAVDPHRVQAAAPNAGVYFKHPPSGPVAPPLQVQTGFNRPYVGVTIDGDRVIATMVSPPSLRPRDAAIQAGDNFEAVTAVKCLQLPSGRVLWDTDSPALQEEFRRMMAKSNSGLGFWDRNFSFCGAPQVDGGRVYLGVCTSPLAEQESAVLCLDRASGRPLWATSIASFVPARGGGFPAGRAAIYQTLLALEGGLVVAQTNLGVVAGLDPATGRTAWLTRYRRARMRENGQGEPTFLRPANWPVAWQGDVYVLPQDRPELLAFEAATGRPKALPPLRVTDQDVDVRSLTHLLGVANGMLVITGSLSHVVQLSDFRAYTLSVSDAQRAGRGAIVGDRVYLPVSSTSAPSKSEAPGVTKGALGIYDQRTWKSVGMPSWRGENEYGNLLAAGRTLVVATNRISIYTDAASLRREYESRIAQHPPRADALLEYGDLMRENERLEDAADAYLSFIRVAEGDARWEARARQVKGDLHGIYLQRGDEAADPKRALEYYGLAKGFAFDDASRAEASRKLAESLEKSGRWADAVAQYQELIERGRGLYHREADGVRKLAHYARERVDKIVAQAPEAYEEVERRAAAALEEARRQGADALRDVMDRFPNSKTAVDAWRALRDRLRGEGSFERLRGLFRDFEDRFRRGLDFEDMRGLLEVLEKTSDAERLRVELDRFAAAYGDRDVGTAEKPETARAWAARRKGELQAAGPPAARGIRPGPLRPVAELEARVPPPDAVHAGSGLSPLQPLGRGPVGLPPGADLFARGSSIELWDVREKRRLWACARPGGWLGLSVEESEEGVVTVDSVVPGSPAEKGGVEEADELLAIDGRGAGPEELADRLRELGAGRSTELVLRREGKELRIRLTTAALPAELRPAVFASAWTCDGSLAVAWEDGVASIDPADGRVRWTSDDLRRGFAVRGFHAVDGRLLVYEAPVPGPGQQPVRPNAPAEGPAHRLIALSDVTGELAWAHPFPAEAAPGAGEGSVAFLGRYFGEHVSLLQSVPRSNAPEWYLWTFKASTGEKPEKRMLPQILSWAVDETAGVLYYLAEPANERRGGERKLESRSIDPAKPGFKQLDLALRPGEHVPTAGPTLTTFSLAAEGEYVVLMAASAAEHRIRVFKNGALFRSLSLREGRTLASGRPEGALLENGVLHVLNVPRDGGGVAYLTAFRIDAPEPSGLVAWEAVAPLPPGPAAPWTLVSGGPSCLALVVPGATLDGATASGAAFVYDRTAGGRLRLARAADGAAFTQGRLYVSGRDRTEVFGE